MGVVSTKIFLENYEVDINIGIHEFEKTGPQRIIINIELFVAGALSGNGDTIDHAVDYDCLLYTSPSPRDRQKSRMPSSA